MLVLIFNQIRTPAGTGRKKCIKMSGTDETEKVMLVNL